MKKHLPAAIVVPRLGDLQRTSALRIEASKKGYTGGHTEVLILDLHNIYDGIATELKTTNWPWGVISKTDGIFRRTQNIYVLVS